MSTLDRRKFLISGASALTAFSLTPAFFGWNGGRRSLSDKPNVLLILCDDLNDSVSGMGGHPQAFTPNINRLVKRGMKFTNAHCNAPICGPSRASLWTGIYPHTSGLYGYNQEENPWRHNPTLCDAITVFEHFMAHGYDVYGTGKVFHNFHEDNTVWLRPDGFNGLGLGPSFGPFPWDGVSYTPMGFRKGCGHPSMPAPFNTLLYDSFAPLCDVPTVGGYTGWSLDSEDFYYSSDEDRDLVPDERSVQWVAERLKESHANPFFITLGLNRPHAPRYVPTPFYDLFPLNRIQLPPYLSQDLEDCSAILWKHPETGKPTPDSQYLRKLLMAGGPELWKRWIQSYLAAAAFVDAQVGAVMKALDESRYADNTIVLLAGDHGFHMGEKDHMKKTTIWEEVTRVPLVIAAPGLASPDSKCENPVSLIDLYPTLNDLCGLPPDPNSGGNGVPLGGFSLRPFLENPQGPWEGPSVALSCLHGWDPVPPNHPARLDRQNFSVRSKRWRYTRCYDGSEELYNHGADPHEWTNLAQDPAYEEIKKSLRHELMQMTGLAPEGPMMKPHSKAQKTGF